ncbi:hypothetical protein AC579_1767 [Pseudocercospora musae]|uniref:Uncharacterized protein n=1 Tax=Pseudocercospora musae TaxID=113226 RepID=A0A139IPE6_9PEZI|nr:hypothetical protein AC579_1767 [Pseudocercospora musae]
MAISKGRSKIYIRPGQGRQMGGQTHGTIFLLNTKKAHTTPSPSPLMGSSSSMPYIHRLPTYHKIQAPAATPAATAATASTAKTSQIVPTVGDCTDCNNCSNCKDCSRLSNESNQTGVHKDKKKGMEYSVGSVSSGGGAPPPPYSEGKGGIGRQVVDEVTTKVVREG